MKVVTGNFPTEIGDGAEIRVNGELVIFLSDTLTEAERTAILSRYDEAVPLAA